MYGTVRTVVWEDGGGNPASYPILLIKQFLEPLNFIDKRLIVGTELSQDAESQFSNSRKRENKPFFENAISQNALQNSERVRCQCQERRKKSSGQLGGAEKLTQKFYASNHCYRAVMTHVFEDAFLIACDAENVFRFFYSAAIDISKKKSK